jgi:hypothetical protein
MELMHRVVENEHSLIGGLMSYFEMLLVTFLSVLLVTIPSVLAYDCGKLKTEKRFLHSKLLWSLTIAYYSVLITAWWMNWLQ